jgi:hypothetical protein
MPTQLPKFIIQIKDTYANLTGTDPTKNLKDGQIGLETDGDKRMLYRTWEPGSSAGSTLGTVSAVSLGDNLGDHTATESLKLNDNYLSNDGGSEGISVDDDGIVSTSTHFFMGDDQEVRLGGTVLSPSSYLKYNSTGDTLNISSGVNSLSLKLTGEGASISSACSSIALASCSIAITTSRSIEIDSVGDITIEASSGEVVVRTTTLEKDIDIISTGCATLSGLLGLDLIADSGDVDIKSTRNNIYINAACSNGSIRLYAGPINNPTPKPGQIDICGLIHLFNPSIAAGSKYLKWDASSKFVTVCSV